MSLWPPGLLALRSFSQRGKIVIVNGSAWRARAGRQQTANRDIPAPRGRVLDESGRILAQNQEKVRLDVTPREHAEEERSREHADHPESEPHAHGHVREEHRGARAGFARGRRFRPIC